MRVFRAHDGAEVSYGFDDAGNYAWNVTPSALAHADARAADHTLVPGKAGFPRPFVEGDKANGPRRLEVPSEADINERSLDVAEILVANEIPPFHVGISWVAGSMGDPHWQDCSMATLRQMVQVLASEPLGNLIGVAPDEIHQVSDKVLEAASQAMLTGVLDYLVLVELPQQTGGRPVWELGPEDFEGWHPEQAKVWSALAELGRSIEGIKHLAFEGLTQAIDQHNEWSWFDRVGVGEQTIVTVERGPRGELFVPRRYQSTMAMSRALTPNAETGWPLAERAGSRHPAVSLRLDLLERCTLAAQHALGLRGATPNDVAGAWVADSLAREAGMTYLRDFLIEQAPECIAPLLDVDPSEVEAQWYVSQAAAQVVLLRMGASALPDLGKDLPKAGELLVAAVQTHNQSLGIGFGG